MNIKNITVLSIFLALLLTFCACGSASAASNAPEATNNNAGMSNGQSAATETDAGSNNQSTTTTDMQSNTNTASTIAMLECEAMPNVSDGNGNIYTAYTMPLIPDPNSYTGIGDSAPMCVAGVEGADGTIMVNAPSNLPSCLESTVTRFQTGSVIPVYLVPEGSQYCIAVNGD